VCVGAQQVYGPKEPVVHEGHETPEAWRVYVPKTKKGNPKVEVP